MPPCQACAVLKMSFAPAFPLNVFFYHEEFFGHKTQRPVGKDLDWSLLRQMLKDRDFISKFQCSQPKRASSGKSSLGFGPDLGDEVPETIQEVDEVRPTCFLSHLQGLILRSGFREDGSSGRRLKSRLIAQWTCFRGCMGLPGPVQRALPLVFTPCWWGPLAMDAVIALG